ncbi:hypothetical protein HWC82_gp45 [Gordonia phage Yikes]|uniref:Uncharacterized protein n=1 Tax=Gordonia phage Yikes TaxID=2656545 RepID=A0A649VH18_9CAUD|nr:hypothetical protein HWC82_gp45 [Gordonia phage Yikes]QGJ91033.1 hypothetical protein PBI_YIKES_45 [Gordonia phage Yikes]
MLELYPVKFEHPIGSLAQSALSNERECGMKITANHPTHGLYQASARAVDEAIAKYLPASVEELREKVHERTDVDYSDVDSVSFFLVMLAEWDGVECGPSNLCSDCIQKVLDALARDDLEEVARIHTASYDHH